MSTSSTISISITPVNDPPVITVPLAEDGTKTRFLHEDSQMRITGVLFHGRPLSTPVESYQSGYELFRSEGVRPDADWPGWRYRVAAHLWPGRSSSSPMYFTNYRGSMYFSADDGVNGRELWRTSHSVLEQSQAATELVKDIYPGSRESDPRWLTVLQDRLYFSASGVDTTWMEFSDACQGFRQSKRFPEVRYAIASHNVWDMAYVHDCPSGYHWMSTDEALSYVSSDSAHSGEQMIPSYFDQCGWDGFVWNGLRRVKFRFSDSHATGAYKSVGTAEEGELIVGDFTREEFAGVMCAKGEVASDDNERCRSKLTDATPTMPGLPVEHCYIRAGIELWSSDGTQNGTYRVSDLNPGVSDSKPAYLTAHEASGSIFFTAFGATTGRELFRTDGTANGTILLEDIFYGIKGSNPRYLTLLDPLAAAPTIFFAADDGLRGDELWMSDGTSINEGDSSGRGTRIVHDISPGGEPSSPKWITSIAASEVMFAATDGVLGRELWISNGTSAGTRIVRDIWPGAAGSDPSHLIEYNSVVYFSASDGTTGAEIWRSDGTFSGTYRLFDLCSGACAGSPAFFAILDPPLLASSPPLLFFTANPGIKGRQLWRTDGTLAGTFRAFQETQNDIDIDESAHLQDFPVRIATYHGALFWSGNEGTTDITNPRGGVYGGYRSTSTEAAIAVDDVDADGARMLVRMSANKGTLSLARVQGLEFLEGDGTSDTSMEFLATLLDLNLALEWLDYATLPDEHGADAVSVSVNDTGATGAYGQAHNVINTIDVYIYEVNDAPTLTGPELVHATRDLENLVEGITLADVDAGTSPVEISVRVRHGRVTLNSIKDLSFGGRRGAGTGLRDRSMVFHATIETANRALRVLKYVCLSKEHCHAFEDKITFQVRDLDLSGDQKRYATRKTMRIAIRDMNIDEQQLNRDGGDML